MGKREELQQMLDKMTPEEERAYWDAQDPWRQGKRVRTFRLQPPPDRLSYFALRLSGKDIDRLADLAESRGMKPSELARALILQGLEQMEGQPGIEGRIAALEKEFEGLRQQLADLRTPASTAAS